MKMKKILFLSLAWFLAFIFVSCSDDNDTRTDASVLVKGTYSGTELTTEDETAVLTMNPDGLKITVEKYEAENTQASTVTISGTVSNSSTGRDYSINESFVMNTSKANNGYLLVSSTQNLMYCRIDGNTLICYLKMTNAGAIKAAGKVYTLSAIKVAEQSK